MEDNCANLIPNCHDNTTGPFLKPHSKRHGKSRVSHSSLCDRPVLRTLTNTIDRNSSHLVHSGPRNIPAKHLSTATLVDTRQCQATGNPIAVKHHRQFDQRRGRPWPSHCESISESGYGGSDAENVPLAVCTALDGVESDSSSNSPPFPAKRRRHSSSDTIDLSEEQDCCLEPESDQYSFKPKLACDIVRAAFADRVQLEQLLAECRYADYALLAANRSPADRMMEAADYVVGIMAYEQMREHKECYRVSDFLGKRQPYITSDMLATLADWFIEVQDVFLFNHETIHLAWGLLYSYLDRSEPVHKSHVQLMALAAIIVACKHEESKLPRVSELLYITDGSYRHDDFIAAEMDLLVVTDFAVHRPNAYVFLRRFTRVLDALSGNIQYMSRFLLDCGLHSHTISLKRDSHKAAACLWLSRVVCRNPSHDKWLNRSDVRYLRQLIRSHQTVDRFYKNCVSSANLHFHQTNLRVRKMMINSHPICPRSGALDLTVTNKLAANYPSPNIGRSSSSTTDVTRLDDADETKNDAHTDSTMASSIMERTHSEPAIGRSISKMVPPIKVLGSVSAPSESHNSHPIETEPDEIDLHSNLKRQLQAMKAEEEQRAPIWPPILQHITGYGEKDLIPLAKRYHLIAMRLIAEVARGGHLALERQAAATAKGAIPVEDDDDDYDMDPDGNSHGQRCVSPGGHYLRRQVVSKYCTADFDNIANAYPQLAYENFVSHFPEVQCPQKCVCFVCRNLIRTT